ncbi:type 1 fimbrial protein [Herbaspirillum autotrophicum]|uniref:type 1 fimbrial protein n=1 Tax=Herbaspirillum autotrophicum TaxID=180195 RepID=UPI00067B1227|nr:type 1 fimbrial protein [Herbaspirillum autotrophicum]
MFEKPLQLRHLVALSLFSATSLSTFADSGSIGFQGRIVDPTCTIRGAGSGDRHLNCHTAQHVQIRVTQVGKSTGGARFALDGKPLENARLVTHRLQAGKHVALKDIVQTPAGNAVIVLFSYL